MNRPLVPVVLAFAGGIFIAAQWEGISIAWWLNLTAGSLGVAALMYRPGIGRIATVSLAFLAVGGLWWTVRNAGAPGDELYHTLLSEPPAPSWSLEGRVHWTGSIAPQDGYQRFILDVSTVDRGEGPEAIGGRVLVRQSGAERPVYPGEQVRVRGRLQPVIGPVNPRIQGEEDHMRRRGVHSAVRIRGRDGMERLSETSRWNPQYVIARLRHAQRDRLASAAPESVLPFVLAVWLGDRSGVARDEIDGYARSGTAHILAVSGIHVGLLFASVSMLVGLLTPHRRRRAAIVLSVLIAYALLAGARTPTVRAVTMIAFYLAAGWFDREPDVPSALAAAGFLLLFISPNALFDMGFQLSFLSVASILIFHEAFGRGLGFMPRLLREGASTTLAVQILPLPLAVRYFGIVPLAAPLTNLLVVPLLSVALWFAFLTSLLSWVSISIAGLFGHALVPVVYLIRMISGFVASSDSAVLRLTAPTALAMASFWAAAILLGYGVKGIHARRCLFAAIGLLVLAAAVWIPIRYRPEMVFLDVGHGDATFIRTRYGATALVDAGDRMPFVDQGARVVEPFLRASGVRQLDHLIITHPHRDHIGGAFHIIETMPVGQVLLSNVNSDADLEAELLALCEEKGIPVRRVGRGDLLPMAGGRLEFFHPQGDWPADRGLNNASVVARAHIEEVAVLLPGDVEADAERALASLDCSAPILKAPHHGSDTSSTEVFLDAVRPIAVIASTGYDGVAAEVELRYRERGLLVFRTDYHGGVTLTPRQNALHIKSARQTRGYLPTGARSRIP